MSISAAYMYVVGEDPQLGANLERLFRTSGFSAQSFDSGQAFLDALPELRPGCLFVDLATPGMSGLDFLRQLRASGCHWPVIILTGDAGPAKAEEAMQAGAFALMEKPAREVEVLALAHKAQIDISAEAGLLYDEEIAERIERLSRREREVLDGILAGLLNKQIAGPLGVSESTVKTARRKLLERMQAETTLELIAMALRAGLKIKTGS